MNKYIVPILLIVLALIVSYCNPSKKIAAAEKSKITYETGVSNIIATSCSPCHIPANGGNKKAFDNYVNVKSDIDEIIRRIELNPGERGFMPFKKSAKLSDSTINVFKKWRDDGLNEK